MDIVSVRYGCDVWNSNSCSGACRDWSVIQTMTSNGGTDWYESRVAEHEVALEDIISILSPSVSNSGID